MICNIYLDLHIFSEINYINSQIEQTYDDLIEYNALLYINRGTVDYLRWGCRRYLLIVSLLPTVDASQHAPQFAGAQKNDTTKAKQ